MAQSNEFMDYILNRTTEHHNELGLVNSLSCVFCCERY